MSLTRMTDLKTFYRNFKRKYYLEFLVVCQMAFGKLHTSFKVRRKKSMSSKKKCLSFHTHLKDR